MEIFQDVFMIVDLFFFCCICIATVKVLGIRSKRIIELEDKVVANEVYLTTLYTAILKDVPNTLFINNPDSARLTSDFVKGMHEALLAAHNEGLVRQNLVDVTSTTNQ